MDWLYVHIQPLCPPVATWGTAERENPLELKKPLFPSDPSTIIEAFTCWQDDLWPGMKINFRLPSHGLLSVWKKLWRNFYFQCDMTAPCDWLMCPESSWELTQYGVKCYTTGYSAPKSRRRKLFCHIGNLIKIKWHDFLSLPGPCLALTSLPVPCRRVEPADAVCRLVCGQRAASAGPAQPSQWHGETHRRHRRWLGCGWSAADWLTLLLLLQLNLDLQLTEEEQKLLSQEGVSLPNNLPLTKVHLNSSLPPLSSTSSSTSISTILFSLFLFFYSCPPLLFYLPPSSFPSHHLPP